jgi:hypothetical protein
MTEKQLSAVRCALADLCGALQAFNQNDIHIHDWRAHQQSIAELAEAFDLEDEVPEELK